jgi:hypothetical protein
MCVHASCIDRRPYLHTHKYLTGPRSRSNNTRGSTALLRSPTDVPFPLLLQISSIYPDGSDHLQANASLSGIVIASHDSLGTICSSHTAVAFATAASRKSAAASCTHTLCRYFKRLVLLAAWPIGRNQPASPLTSSIDMRASGRATYHRRTRGANASSAHTASQY